MARTRRRRVAITALLFLVLLGAVPPAAATEEDFERGMQLTRDGLHTPEKLEAARRVFQGMLKKPGARRADQDLARFGLVMLARNAALARTVDDTQPYAEVRKGFLEAVALLKAFVSSHAGHPRRVDAQIAIATTALGQAGWARELLSEPDAMSKRGVESKRAQADAVVAAEQAVAHLRALRDDLDGSPPHPAHALVSMHLGIALRQRAEVLTPGLQADQRRRLLDEAARRLEQVIFFHDGGPVAAHAQDQRGLVAWERARHADAESAQERHLLDAARWFEGLVGAPAVTPRLRPVCALAALHLARVCLGGARTGRTNFHRYGANALAEAYERNPWLWSEPDGIRAALVWSAIEAARERSTAAVRVAGRAVEHVAALEDPFLEQAVGLWLLLLVEMNDGRLARSASPDLLLQAARAAIRAGAPRKAIELARRTIAAADSSREAFLAQRWPAWRLIADAHQRLDQPLHVALALEPVHEAWITGLIPGAPEAASREHLLEAGRDRRRAQGALRAAAKRGAPLLLAARITEMERLLTRDYPGHPAREATPFEAPAADARTPLPPEPPRWTPAFDLTPTEAKPAASAPTPKLSTSLEAALRWLAAHQSPNGGWEAMGFGTWYDGRPILDSEKRPRGTGMATFDPGVTGLALCAFLGAGYTHRGTHPFNRTVARGLLYLRNIQDPEGCFGPRSTQRYIYNHATAALACVEAYRLTGSQVLRQPAQRCLDFIALARNPYFAWRYGIKPGDNDTSVSGWMMLALESAQHINKDAVKRGRPAPLWTDESAFDGLRAWLDKTTDPDYGSVGYVMRGIYGIRYKGHHESFPLDKTLGCTPVGMLARMFIGEDPRKSKLIKLGVDLCLKQPPMWNTATGEIDMIAWYYATLALRRVDGKPWKAWRTALGKALAKGQRKDTDAMQYLGSCDPVGKWGTFGGRVYATAMLALMRAVYDGHETVFGLEPR